MNNEEIKVFKKGLKDFTFIKIIIILFFLLIILLIGSPITIVPAGHIGVKDFFGIVSKNGLAPGIHFVIPFTKVIKISVRTEEMLEMAEVPSKEGLIMNLDVSLLFHLKEEFAPEMYKKVGKNYQKIVVEPQFRSAIREITASYEAKALYSAERDKVAKEIFELVKKLTEERGIVVEQVLLRKIGLPTIVANAIQEKLRREQEAEQMKFILQKEQQEAERKRIEAQGIADFQKIVSQGISPQLLEWKGIEATEKLANSPNSKIVIIGNPKTGLPVILSTEK